MKKPFLFLMLFLSLFFVPFTAVAEQYEHPMLDLIVPSGLQADQLYIEIDHKFLRSLAENDPNDFFASLNYGSNVRISLRYMVIPNLEILTSYISFHREKTIGGAYTIKMPDMYFNTKLEAQYINKQDLNLAPPVAPVMQGGFVDLALETVPFLDNRINVALDLGYDGVISHVGLGVGASVEIIRHLSLVGEFYPVLNQYGDNNLPCYGFGINIETSGHQFMIRASNIEEIGARDMMMGSQDNDIYIGFDIMRLLIF